MRQAGPDALLLRSGLRPRCVDEPIKDENGPADPNYGIENHTDSPSSAADIAANTCFRIKNVRTFEVSCARALRSATILSRFSAWSSFNQLTQRRNPLFGVIWHLAGSGRHVQMQIPRDNPFPRSFCGRLPGDPPKLQQRQPSLPLEQLH